MKKLVILTMLTLLLTGCGGELTYETVTDVYQTPENIAAQKVAVALPEEAAQSVMGGDQQGRLYFCDGYTVSVQTLAAGDLDATLRAVTGYGRDALTLMEQQQGTCKRYDCVWTCVGEGGDHVGRTAILDDGTYHYVLTAMAEAENAGKLSAAWQKLFTSFRVG